MVLLLAVLGCAQAPEASLLPVGDEGSLDTVMRLVDHETALELLDSLVDELPSCAPAAFEDGPGLRETWTCPVAPGAVDRYEDPDLAWMEVSGLALDDFRMDGAIELVAEDEVSSLEFAATLCGEGWADCDDALQVDLSWTLVQEGEVQEVLVTGTAVTPELGPVAVEGTYAVDLARCDQPLDGLLVLEGERIQGFRFSEDCACADWTLDGDPVDGTWCR